MKTKLTMSFNEEEARYIINALNKYRAYTAQIIEKEKNADYPDEDLIEIRKTREEKIWHIFDRMKKNYDLTF